MESMTHSHRVLIAGEKFQIKSDQPPEVIEKIAGYLDYKIQELENNSIHGDKFRLTVLAAMNIAGEYFEMKEKMNELEKNSREAQEKARLMSTSLDKIMC